MIDNLRLVPPPGQRIPHYGSFAWCRDWTVQLLLLIRIRVYFFSCLSHNPLAFSTLRHKLISQIVLKDLYMRPQFQSKTFVMPVYSVQHGICHLKHSSALQNVEFSSWSQCWPVSVQATVLRARMTWRCTTVSHAKVWTNYGSWTTSGPSTHANRLATAKWTCTPNDPSTEFHDGHIYF